MAPTATFPRRVIDMRANLLRAGSRRYRGHGEGPALPGPEMLATERDLLNDRRRKLHISSRRLIRSARGGCVLNSFSSAPILSPSTREGWLSHRCAVALLAERIAVGLAASFLSAL